MKIVHQIYSLPLRKKHVFALGVVLALGILLRSLFLGRQGLFFDEAWSWAAARLSLPDLVSLTLSDPHPPFYYILLKLALLTIPSTESGLRVLSVACAVATQLYIMVFVFQHWGTRAAVYSGLFVALSSFDIYYAQEARMYTLLGLLWVISYISLIKILHGSSFSIIVWTIANITMAWTHLYGILIVLIELFLIFTYFVVRHLRQRTYNHTSFWLIIATIGVVLGIIPILLLVLHYRATGAGGAWIPTVKDFVVLFALWSVGLTAVHGYFLDSVHLVWPFFSSISVEIWAALGVLTSGLFVVLGLKHAWNIDKTKRMAAALAILLLVLPPLVVFGLAIGFQQRWWALKPFLGAAYIYYLWAGIGLSQIQSRWFQRFAIVAICIIALFSLNPYFTLWQKSESVAALRSISQIDDRNIVLIEPKYISVLARFYLGPDVPLWQIYEQGEAIFMREISDITNSTTASLAFVCTKSSTPLYSTVTRIWIYGSHDRVMQLLPSCFAQAELWVFDENRWVVLNR